MIDFVKSTEMKISLAPDQEGMLSTKETIKTIIRDNPDTVLAFDIFDENDLIGFILVNRFEEHKYFLLRFLSAAFRRYIKGICPNPFCALPALYKFRVCRPSRL